MLPLFRVPFLLLQIYLSSLHSAYFMCLSSVSGVVARSTPRRPACPWQTLSPPPDIGPDETLHRCQGICKVRVTGKALYTALNRGRLCFFIFHRVATPFWHPTVSDTSYSLETPKLPNSHAMLDVRHYCTTQNARKQHETRPSASTKGSMRDAPPPSHQNQCRSQLCQPVRQTKSPTKQEIRNIHAPTDPI